MSAPDLETVRREELRIMNAFAPVYREAKESGSFVYRRERRLFVEWMLRMLRRAHGDAKPLRYLDVGTGTGEILELLRDRGCTDLTGVDLSDAMLEEARRNVGDGARLVDGAVEDGILNGERFDVVVAAYTVHHLHDPSSFFRLADRLLEPGGWFFVLEFDSGSVAQRRKPRRMLTRVTWPLRAPVKRKNRARLARMPIAPFEVNPAHRLMSSRDMKEAHPAPDRYAWRYRSHAFFLPLFINSFVNDSAVDEVLIRSIGALDALAVPLGGGQYQWVAGQKCS